MVRPKSRTAVIRVLVALALAIGGLVAGIAPAQATGTDSLNTVIAEANSTVNMTLAQVKTQPWVPTTSDYQGYGGDWCAWFVSALLHNNGMPLETTVGTSGQTSGTVVSWYQGQGRYKTVASGGAPTPGALIIYSVGHVGLVTGVSGGVAQTVEGNTGYTRLNLPDGDWAQSEVTAFGSPWGDVLGYAYPQYGSYDSLTGQGDPGGVTTPAPAPTPPTLYQAHSDGAIFQYTGAPCGSAGCNGWVQIDGAGSGVVQLAGGNGTVYMLRNDGALFQYTGQPCTSSGCSGWAMLDGAGSGITQIAAGNGALYIQINNGAIFQYTGQACTSSGCSGWVQLDGPNSGAVQITAGANAAGTPVVNMRRSDGAIFQYTGQPCTSSGCNGWAMLDGGGSGAVGMASNGSALYIQINNGAIFQYTQQACTSAGCSGWVQLDGPNSGAVQITAGANSAGTPVVNMRRSDGAIFQYTGTPCTSGGCNGWAMLDGPNSGVNQMTSDGPSMFIQVNQGPLFQYTQQSCTASGCAGWVQLDASTGTTLITT